MQKNLPVVKGYLPKLMVRMEEVYADSHYQAVWLCYANHGGNYSDGPKWVDEFNAAKNLIFNQPSTQPEDK